MRIVPEFLKSCIADPTNTFLPIRQFHVERAGIPTDRRRDEGEDGRPHEGLREVLALPASTGLGSGRSGSKRRTSEGAL